MNHLLIAYLIGVIAASYALIRRIVTIQNNLTVTDIFFTLLCSFGSWVTYFLFSDWILETLVKIGSITLWKKKIPPHLTEKKGK